MGIRNTLRNKHRKNKFLQDGGAAPGKSRTPLQNYIDGLKSRDDVVRDETRRQSIEIQNRVSAARASAEEKARIQRIKRAEENTAVPIHEETVFDSLAKRAEILRDEAIAERETQLKKQIDEIDTRANADIAAENLRLASLSEAAKAAQDQSDNYKRYVGVKPTPQQIIVINTLKASANARTQAMKQATDFVGKKIISLQKARDEAFDRLAEKAANDKAIYGWTKIAADMTVVAPIIKQATEVARVTFSDTILKIFGVKSDVLGRVARVEASRDDIKVNQRTLANIVLTQTANPLRLTAEINDKNILITKLNSDNALLNQKLGSLVKEVKMRSDALPGLLDAASKLQRDHDAAVAERRALEAQRDSLTAPDDTAALADINQEIDFVNLIIPDITAQLSRAGTDIINAVSARDFLIAAKADAEGGVLSQMVRDITGSDPALTNSKDALDSAKAMNDRITTALSDIAKAVQPFKDQSAALKQLILDIQGRIGINSGIIQDQNGLLVNKGSELTTATQLLADTIRQKGIDIASLKDINDTIAALLATQASHENFTTDIVAVLEMAHNLEGTLNQLGRDDLKALADEIKRYLGTELAPALVITAKDEGTAFDAFTDADGNLADTNSDIDIKTQAINTLQVLQGIIIADIASRGSTAHKILHDTNQAIAKAKGDAAIIASDVARALADAIKSAFDSTAAKKSAEDLIKAEKERSELQESLGDVGSALITATTAEAAAALKAREASDAAAVISDTLLPPVESRIGSEDSQATRLDGELVTLGPRPADPSVPRIEAPPRPPSSGDRAELAGLVVPPIPVDGTPAAIDAKTEATAAAQALANPADASSALGDARARAQDVEAGLKAQAAVLDGIDTTGPVTANEGASKQLANDTATLETMALGLQPVPVAPDTSLVDGLREAVPLRESEVPPLQDPPSHTPAGLEAMMKAPVLADAARVALTAAGTARNSRPTDAEIAAKISEIQSFINGELARASAESQARYAELIAKNSNAKLTELTNAKDARDALHKLHAAAIIDKATLSQRLADLESLFSTRNSREAQQINASSGSENASAARAEAKRLRQAASAAVLQGNPTDALNALGESSGSAASLADTTAAREAARQAAEDADAAAAIDVTGDAANAAAVKSLLEATNGFVRAVEARQRAESAQADALAKTLLESQRPADPAAVNDTRRAIAAEAAAEGARRQAAKAELDGLTVPPVPTRDGIVAAEAAKEAAKADATRPPNSDPVVALNDAKGVASLREAALKLQDTVRLSAEAAVAAADRLNVLRAEALRLAEIAKASKAEAVRLAEIARTSAKDAVDAGDPTPFNEAVTAREGELPNPVQEPSRVPPPKDPIELAAALGEKDAAAAAAKRDKEQNERDMDYLENSIESGLNAISTDLFDMPNIVDPTTRLTNATTALTDAVTRLTNVTTSRDNAEQAFKDLNNLLSDLNKELTVRQNLKLALDATGIVRDNFKTLRDSLKALRDGMTRVPTSDKAAATETVSILNDAISKLGEKIGERDGLRDTDIPAVDGNLEAARNAERDAASAKDDAARQRDSLGDTLRDNLEPRIRSEDAQAAKLAAELTGDRPTDPQPVVDNRAAPADAATLANAEATRVREELAGLQDPGPPSPQAIADAETAKQKAKDDAETLRKQAIDDAKKALKDESDMRDSLNGELTYALRRLEAATTEVTKGRFDIVSFINGLFGVKTEAARRLAIVKDLKTAIDKYNKTIDDAKKLLDSLHPENVPPIEGPPARPDPRPDLSDKLAEFKKLLDDAAVAKDDVFKRIETIKEDLPGLNEDINHAIERVADLFRRIDDTDMLKKAADLATAKATRDNLNDMDAAGLKRIENLKELKLSLESYSDVLVKRELSHLEAMGKAEAARLAREAARKAREDADAKEVAKKDEALLELKRLEDAIAEAEAKKKERDDAEDMDDAADLELLKLQMLKKELMESIFGKKIQELDNIKAEIDRLRRNKKDADDDIARIQRELDEAKKKNDPDLIKRLQDDLARLKRLRDDLQQRIKLREADRDALAKKIADDIARRKKEQEALDALNKNKSERRADLPSFMPDLGTIGSVAALAALAGLGAYGISGLLGTSTDTPSINLDDGSADGKRDGREAGNNDGAGNADGNAYAANEAASGTTPDISAPVGEEAVAEEAVVEAEAEAEDQEAKEAEDQEAEEAYGANNVNVSFGGGIYNNNANMNSNTNTNKNTDEITNANKNANVNTDVNTEPPETPQAPEIPQAPEATPQISLDDVPDPTNIPYPESKLVGKSAKYIRTYKPAFKDAYISAYKIQFQTAANSYRANNLPTVSSADQQPGEMYHIKSDVYGIDGDYILLLQDTGEYYEIQKDKKIILLTTDADSIAIYRASDDIEDEPPSNNGAYLQYKLVGEEDNTLIILAADIDSDPPLVTVTAIEEVVPTPEEVVPTPEEVVPTPEEAPEEVEPTY